MSAWAVWGWLGFYPLTGTDLYMLGAPRFPHVRLKPFGTDGAGANITITVRAHGASTSAVFVRGCTWDGVNLTAPLLSHKLVAAGGKLECWMTTRREQAAWTSQ